MKTALVLGATGSLGKAISKQLQEMGYTVIGTTRKPQQSDIELLTLEIKDRESIDTFMQTIATRGPIDFFTSTIANKPTLERFEHTTAQTIESDMQVNALHHHYLIQKLLPHCNERAHIMFILTEAVQFSPAKYMSSYIISKYALLGVMQTLAAEAPKHIRVNAVSPGMMDTPFIAHFPSFTKEKYKNDSPQHRLVTPDEVAQAIAHLVRTDAHGMNVPVKSE